MLTRDERSNLINAILAEMAQAYEDEGIEGDFDDARRYYRDDATDEEIINNHKQWCKKA